MPLLQEGLWELHCQVLILASFDRAEFLEVASLTIEDMDSDSDSRFVNVGDMNSRIPDLQSFTANNKQLLNIALSLTGFPKWGFLQSI